ncbi:MAG TPA: thiamine-phosphate kinase [Pirellulales bacterium]|jgi:thiamine-monophosphate kinase
MEAEFIAWLKERLPRHEQLTLGIGDDAALVRLRERGDLLVSSDMLMDTVDFHLDQVDPRRVGRKALAVNLSDIAAMAGRPLAAVISVALPRQAGLPLAQQLCEGFLPLAERYDVAIAGGDTNSWDGPLVINVTILGEPTARGALTRRGAQPGDVILVTGSFGGSILGRHFGFEPRVAEALALHARYDLHAGIDVSDGLSLDLSRLAAASDCGALVDLVRVPIDDAAHELARREVATTTALDHALSDGEDFELILAVSPATARRMLEDQPLGVPLTEIGRFVAEPGLWQTDPFGGRRLLEPRGFLH